MKLNENVRIAIIEKMVKHRLWGGKHASINNIPKGFPPSMLKGVKPHAAKAACVSFRLALYPSAT